MFNLETLMFFIFAAVSVYAALGMVFSKNAIYSALLLLLNFCMMAGLYILLSAQFIAAVQIMVYAGAIVVLILFVVMLLGAELGETITSWITPKTAIAALLAFTLLAVTGTAVGSSQANPIEIEALAEWGSPKAVGLSLLTDYVLAFEFTGILLTVGIVGVVILGEWGQSNPDEEAN